MILNKLEGKFDDGYDSNGKYGPFFDLEDIKGLQIFDEEAMMERTEDDMNKKMQKGLTKQTINQPK